MGFHSVFRALQELFPTVDARVLKAIAIEHPKDADVAAEVVLNEILPSHINDSFEDQGFSSGVKGQIYLSGLGRPGPSCGITDQGSSSGIKNQVFFSGFGRPGPSSRTYDQGSPSGIKHLSPFPGTKIREMSPDFKYRDALLAEREGNGMHGNLVRPHRSGFDLGTSPHSGSASRDNVSRGGLKSAGSEDHATSGIVNSNRNEILMSPRKAAGHSGEVSLDQVACIASDKTVHSNSGNNDEEERCRSVGSEEQTSAGKCQENNINNAVKEQIDMAGMPGNVVNVAADDTCGSAEHHELKDSIERTVGNLQIFNPEKENHNVASSTKSTPLGLESSMDQIKLTHVDHGTHTAAHIPLPSGSGSGSGSGSSSSSDAFNDTSEISCSNNLSVLTSVVECPGGDMVEDPNLKSVVAQSGQICITDISADITEDVEICEIPWRNDSSALNSVEYCPGEETVNAEDPNLNSVLAQSGQACRTDVLEEIIENAKTYKKTLVSAMESVMGLMGEVEYNEKAAYEAREEAAKGGLTIVNMVEELKRILPPAKEANDMHAGEVYGEKAILATEAKELQSRLLSLSDEKDNSIEVLDEMRHRLQARLFAAGEVRKAAEKEKSEREVSAKKSLAEQEALMEMVVQESKLIQQQAEENSKLREFLVDRGRLVDALQGEISVICKDVRQLKEKLDQHLPLSESVSSSQTACKLASSISSFKSKASDVALYQSDMILKESIRSSVDDQSVRSVQGEVLWSSNFPGLNSVVEYQSPRTKMLEERVRFDQEMLVDDGWEICNRE